MSTALVFSNSRLLVNLDQNLNISDVFWPHVGMYNHLATKVNEILVMVDGRMSRLSDSEWKITPGYHQKSQVGLSQAINSDLQVEIIFTDFVLHEDDVFIRELEIINHSSEKQEILIFCKNNFVINETDYANTVQWYPDLACLVHYKQQTYLGVGLLSQHYQFCCAGPEDNNGQGAFPNAQGDLWQNPVVTGSAQSCISLKVSLASTEKSKNQLYIAAANSLPELKTVVKKLKEQKIDALLQAEILSQKQWLAAEQFKLELPLISESKRRLTKLFEQSLFLISAHIDHEGAIMAATDYQYVKGNGKDSYSYMWPRDAALIALAMLDFGYASEIRPFWQFCKKALIPEGYFLQRYNPDGTVGSSWHPWVDPQTQKAQLPIQLDSTALTAITFGRYYQLTADTDLLHQLWPDLLRPIAKFLLIYRYLPDQAVSQSLDLAYLPKPSYDLWEVKRGVFTFTCATVTAALQNLRELAEVVGEDDLGQELAEAATNMKMALEKLLYDPQLKRFINGYVSEQGNTVHDSSADASICALWLFDLFPTYDLRIVNTMKFLQEHLQIISEIGGIARKEQDNYLRVDEQIPGNPWIISTLWFTQYYLREGDNKKAWNYLEWVVAHSGATGLLPEQVHPHSGLPLSISPLVWSHATLLSTLKLAQTLNAQND